MLLLLLVLIIIMCVGIYTIRRTFLSPTLIVGIVGIFCIIVALIGNISFWNILFSPTAVMIITVGMVSMAVGEILAASFRIKIKSSPKYSDIPIGKILIPRNVNALLIVFGILVDIYFYRFNVALGLTALEINQTQTEYPMNILLITRSVLAIGFVYVFIIANNIVYRIRTREHDSETIAMIPGLITAFVCQILFTTRSGILTYLMFFAMSLLVSAYRMYEKRVSIRDLKKILRKIERTVIVFFAFFLIMGVVMKKFSNEGIRLLKLIIIYIGGGVLSFSLWLDSSPSQNSTGISETFEGFYAFLSKFGANYKVRGIPNVWARWGDGDFSTNVFMGFKSYYYDWGFVGVIVINFLVGFIYTKLANKAVDRRSGYLTILLCTYFISGIIYTFIGRTFSGMFTLAWWSYIVAIILFSYTIFKKCIFLVAI